MKRSFTRYRAGWRVLATGQVGYGEWSEDQRAIKAWVAARNREDYGSINYWIESSHTARTGQDFDATRAPSRPPPPWRRAETAAEPEPEPGA